MSDDPVRVLVVAGSARRPSFTRAVCDAAAAALVGAGAQVDRWDVANPPCRSPTPPTTGIPAAMRGLVAAAEAADAFVFSTPVYHASFSGVVKNLLDHLGFGQTLYKPASLVGHGGRVRNPTAVDQLRVSLRGLLMVVLPTQVVAAMGDYDESGAVSDSEILGRLDRLSHELVAFTAATRPVREKLIARYA
jgi:azobenzene reductase